MWVYCSSTVMSTDPNGSLQLCVRFPEIVPSIVKEHSIDPPGVGWRTKVSNCRSLPCVSSPPEPRIQNPTSTCLPSMVARVVLLAGATHPPMQPPPYSSLRQINGHDVATCGGWTGGSLGGRDATAAGWRSLASRSAGHHCAPLKTSSRSVGSSPGLGRRITWTPDPGIHSRPVSICAYTCWNPGTKA